VLLRLQVLGIKVLANNMHLRVCQASVYRVVGRVVGRVVSLVVSLVVSCRVMLRVLVVNMNHTTWSSVDRTHECT
jgi:hypothetical protein